MIELAGTLVAIARALPQPAGPRPRRRRLDPHADPCRTAGRAPACRSTPPCGPASFCRSPTIMISAKRSAQPSRLACRERRPTVVATDRGPARAALSAAVHLLMRQREHVAAVVSLGLGQSRRSFRRRPNSKAGPAACWRWPTSMPAPPAWSPIWEVSRSAADRRRNRTADRGRRTRPPMSAATPARRPRPRRSSRRRSRAASSAAVRRCRAGGGRWTNWRGRPLNRCAAAASRMGEILAAGNINAFENFVAAGLKLAAGDKAPAAGILHAAGRARAAH